MRRTPTLLRRFRRDLRGITALEFALVAPAALLVLLLSLETGVWMMADATLTRVTGQIARNMQLYRGPMGGQDCDSRIRAQLATGMYPWVSAGTPLKVSATVYPARTTSGDPDAAILCDTGGAGALIVYTVGFEHPSFTGILKGMGLELLTFERSFLIQNEP
jgi:Flp pilus assembly pilin Flp